MSSVFSPDPDKLKALNLLGFNKKQSATLLGSLDWKLKVGGPTVSGLIDSLEREEEREEAKRLYTKWEQELKAVESVVDSLSKAGRKIMMESGELTTNALMWTKGNNDECYTPDYGVEPILEFIPKDAVVWCPFDSEESEFVQQISENNKVIRSHLEDGQDFFTYEPEEHWDVIISNPPFTNKRKFFERALSFEKPFALIMTNTWLNDSAPKQLFREKDLQLLMFDRRMQFNFPPDQSPFGKWMRGAMEEVEELSKRKGPQITFSSSYYCWNFLPKQIVMRELKLPTKRKIKKNNNGSNK